MHQVSLEKSAEASQELDRQRDVYRDFAKAGSTLFFLVEAMQVLRRTVMVVYPALPFVGDVKLRGKQ